MATYNRTIAVSHRPEDLFDLVSDIARYPDFIRWIRSMRVTGHRETDGVVRCLGEARVGVSGLTEMFATNVVADRPRGRITASLVRGPFRRLENAWTFRPRADGGTDVDFHIDYHFKNPFLQAVLAANFDRAVNALIGAFLAEAERRYEKV